MFVATCGLLVWYFEFEKERMQRKRIAEAAKGVGRPKVGGTFELVDQNGKPFTSEMMKGKHSLVRWKKRTLLYHMMKLMSDILPGLLWLHSMSRYLPRGA